MCNGANDIRQMGFFTRAVEELAVLEGSLQGCWFGIERG